jgi:protein ImuB
MCWLSAMSWWAPDDGERRMTGRPDGPARVLVLRCPEWPEPDPEAREARDVLSPAGTPRGARRGSAGSSLAGRAPGGGAAPGAAPASPEARAFEPVVAVVEEFCPKVEVLWPGACAIGVRGPARYFGGEQALVSKLTAAVRALGLVCRAGVADGLFAAELAARAGLPEPGQAEPTSTPGSAFPDESQQSRRGDPGEAGEPATIVPPGGTPAFLAGQPVSTLGMPDLVSLLPRLGITTLGQFAGLPATEAASRFGAQGMLAHRLARGLDPRPLAPRPPAADLSVRQEFEPPAEQTEPVIFAAKSLAEDLHARLAASGLACVRLQVQVCCADGREMTRFWRHDGLLTGLAVAERVRWQLDSWRTGGPAARGPASRGPASRGPASRGSGSRGPGSRGPGSRGPASRGPASRGPASSGPGGEDESGGAEITLLRLIPDQLVRATGRQLGLWGDAVVSDRVARAAIRVQAMLGHGAVTRPVLAGGRRPVDQVLLVPFGDSRDPQRPADRPWPGTIPAPAPSTVYPVPRPALVTDDAGFPVTVTGRAQASAPPAWLSAAGRTEAGRTESRPPEARRAETGLPEAGRPETDHPQAQLTRLPEAGLPAAGRPPLAITAWAGPWPVTEQWWEPARACRQARFQLVTEDGRAWLAVLQDGRWLVEASYD